MSTEFPSQRTPVQRLKKGLDRAKKPAGALALVAALVGLLVSEHGPLVLELALRVGEKGWPAVVIGLSALAFVLLVRQLHALQQQNTVLHETNVALHDTNEHQAQRFEKVLLSIVEQTGRLGQAVERIEENLFRLGAAVDNLERRLEPTVPLKKMEVPAERGAREGDPT